MMMICNCLDGLDSETFHNYILSTIATAAITEITLYYKRNVLFTNYCKMLLKGRTFYNDDIFIGPMSSSHRFYDNVSRTGQTELL